MTDAFWESREVLRHVRTLARARGVGPWAVLGAVLARAVTTIPPDITLPGIVGGPMSLNLFVAITGPSGAGKGAAEAAARDGFTFKGPIVETVPLGSGEGIARTFRPPGTQHDSPNPVVAAIFTAPEIDTLAAIVARQGSTLSAELRKVYSGEQLGFGNAGKETRVIVPAGTYRACLTIGVQPLRSHALLGASDGGLPQRFVWLPTSDPDAPDEPPPDPGVWKVSRPAWLHAVGSTINLIVPETASKSIRAHRLAVLREDPNVDPLDGHSLLTRLKVAAALMALDGRTIVSEEDWRLAGYVMDVSTYTRERCQRALIEQSRTANAARALATADREEIISDRKLQRAKQAILRKLTDSRQLPRNIIRRSLKADLRDYFDPALDGLLTEGEVTVSPGQRGTQKVPVYQRYTPQKPHSSSEDKTCTESTRVPTGEKSNPTQRPRRRQRTRGKHRTPQQTGEATA
ncbi:hypothetical protein [Mycobacterium canetti]|nr:hypothetical protein [Mycobacterium canetti]MBA2788284.1 hypothetical protein [Mycobacterium canetti]